MPRPGGQSTQGGIRFQDWYGALLLARSFWDPAFVSLKPEALTERNNVGGKTANGVDDLILTYSHQRTVISCKQHAPSESGRWSLAQLSSEGVLSAFVAHYKLYPSDRLQLASVDPHQGKIRELQDRLRHAVEGDINERLERKDLIDLFIELRVRTPELDDSSRLRFLRQLEFAQVQRDSAERDILGWFAFKVSDPKAIPSILFAAMAEWSEYGATVDIHLVRERLRERGIDINVPSAEHVLAAFEEASWVLASEDSSIPNVPDSEQPREAEAKVLTWLQQPKRKPEDGLAVVVGEA